MGDFTFAVRTEYIGRGFVHTHNDVKIGSSAGLPALVSLRLPLSHLCQNGARD